MAPRAHRSQAPAKPAKAPARTPKPVAKARPATKAAKPPARGPQAKPRGTADNARPARRAKTRPVEYSILLTATLCLLAAGAVMVYSASSAESLLDGSGDPSHYLKRYLMLGAAGLAVMHAVSRIGIAAVHRVTPPIVLAGFGLTVAVMVPGVGVTVNGATRWLGAGPLQFQPSEVLKFALVLYAARLLSERGRRVQTFKGMASPLLLVVGGACALLLKQPDMGTAIVVCMSVAAVLVASGARIGHLARVGAVLVFLGTVLAVAEPYRRERLTSFLDPWSDAHDTGFQAVQAMIAMGSGGLFGVGLGESVQKIFYLPEAHTDMILAIIGEELGLVGVLGVASLYGLVAYAGLRAAKAAKDRYAQLVAAGVTSLVLSQATLNLFAVMGLAPLTGVPLPFISYGNSNLVVMLAGMGVLLSVAAGGRTARAPASARGRPRAESARERPQRLRAIDGGGDDARRDRGGRDSGARGARAGDRRRPAR